MALKEAEETQYWLELIDASIREVPEDLKMKCE
ncbi:hypothetical protein [Zunongwangia sp. H14]